MARVPICYLVEKTRRDGQKYMIGKWGNTVVILQPGSPTKGGQNTWKLALAEPEGSQIINPTGTVDLGAAA